MNYGYIYFDKNSMPQQKYKSRMIFIMRLCLDNISLPS